MEFQKKRQIHGIAHINPQPATCTLLRVCHSLCQQKGISLARSGLPTVSCTVTSRHGLVNNGGMLQVVPKCRHSTHALHAHALTQERRGMKGTKLYRREIYAGTEVAFFHSWHGQKHSLET